MTRQFLRIRSDSNNNEHATLLGGLERGILYPGCFVVNQETIALFSPFIYNLVIEFFPAFIMKYSKHTEKDWDSEHPLCRLTDLELTWSFRSLPSPSLRTHEHRQRAKMVCGVTNVGESPADLIPRSVSPDLFSQIT